MVMVVMVEELVEVAEICQVVLLPQVMVLVQEEMSHIREENVGVEALVGTLISSNLGPAGIFVVFLIVLYARPQGLFGKKGRVA